MLIGACRSGAKVPDWRRLELEEPIRKPMSSTKVKAAIKPAVADVPYRPITAGEARGIKEAFDAWKARRGITFPQRSKRAVHS